MNGLIAGALIPLVDRLISLLRERKALNKEVFGELIKPMFERFEPVAEDYIRLFQYMERAAKAQNKEEFRRSIWEFRHDRLKFYPD